MSKRPPSLILIVDDYKPHRDLMVRTLKEEGYHTATAADGFEAIKQIAALHPDLVLLDLNMPGMDGVQVLKKLRGDSQTELLPVILVTIQTESEDKVRGFNAGASDFLIKPWEAPELLARVRAHLRVKTLTDDLEDAEQVLFMLAKIVELRDAYTMEHTERVARYALAIGEVLKVSLSQMRTLEKGAMLHDIGKIGIPDSILRKPGALSPEESRRMRMHPQIGSDITHTLRSLNGVVSIILHHHERWDGKGYPNGLAKQSIPILARIVAVADVFDAVTSDRPYRPGKSFSEGLDLLRQGAGQAWDPDVVAAALQVLPQFETGAVARFRSLLAR